MKIGLDPNSVGKVRIFHKCLKSISMQYLECCLFAYDDVMNIYDFNPVKTTLCTMCTTV